MMNNVVLVGRIVKDVETRYTEQNKAISNFTLAINRTYKNSEGNYETDFINCVAFGKAGETLKEYTNKGDMISVRGKIQTRNYEDKEGNKRYITEVIAEQIGFVPTKNAQNSEKTVQNEKETDPFAEFADEISDEDLPF